MKNLERLSDRYVVMAVAPRRSALIGQGSFGCVVSAWDDVNHEHVAIKIVKKQPAYFRQAQLELEVLASLMRSHGYQWHLVSLKNSFLHNGHQCIVYDLLEKDLYKLLQTNNFRGFSLRTVRRFGKQLLYALHFLRQPIHGPRGTAIVHCDLKPENIMLTARGKCEITVIDLGSAVFDSIESKTSSYIQSRFYRSPEVVLGAGYNASVDMWSLGCILVELHTGRPLFQARNETVLLSSPCS